MTIASLLVVAAIKVACIGDSITYGMCLPDRENTCYPRQLQLMLDATSPGAYEVRNFGNSGRGIYLDTMRGKEKRGFRWMKEHQEALAWKPDIVVCNLGINDYGEFGREPDGLVFGPDAVGKRWHGQFAAEYLLLLRDYAKARPDVKFFIWTKLGPLAKVHGGYGSPLPMKMRPALEEVAAAVGAVGIDMYTPLMTVAETSLKQDGIHPDPAGAKIIAQVTFDALMKDAASKAP